MIINNCTNSSNIDEKLYFPTFFYPKHNFWYCLIWILLDFGDEDENSLRGAGGHGHNNFEDDDDPNTPPPDYSSPEPDQEIETGKWINKNFYVVRNDISFYLVVLVY